MTEPTCGGFQLEAHSEQEGKQSHELVFDKDQFKQVNDVVYTGRR